MWVVELARSLASEPDDDDNVAGGGLADGLPSSLRQLVLRRLADLSEDTVAMLRVAAIVGDTASMRDIAQVAGRTPSDVVVALEEPFRAGLLDVHHERVTFRHQLVRDAIYQELPRAVRQVLHREVAVALTDAVVVAPSMRCCDPDT